MAKDINLLSYWMPVLRKLKEFKEIAKTEEPELRYILEAIDRTLNNMFISTADEQGIKHFESMLGLYPEAGDSLEMRRFRVLAKWNDKVPYTFKELYNRLLSLCGGDISSFDIEEHFTEYWLEVQTHLGVNGMFDEVAELLEEMLPANLELRLHNTIEAPPPISPLYFGVAVCTAMGYLITSDIKAHSVGDGALYYAVGLANAEAHIITHDINAKVENTAPLSEALVGSVGMASQITHDVALEDAVKGSMYGAVGVGIAHTKIITHDIQSRANISGNHAVASPVNNGVVITIKS